jgi:hypothetical protein
LNVLLNEKIYISVLIQTRALLFVLNILDKILKRFPIVKMFIFFRIFLWKLRYYINKMNCELMLTYDTPALRQTGSRNLTGQKTLPTILGIYIKLVTKYQISAINSCWEKCVEKCAYMFNVYKNQLSRCIEIDNCMDFMTEFSRYCASITYVPQTIGFLPRFYRAPLLIGFGRGCPRKTKLWNIIRLDMAYCPSLCKFEIILTLCFLFNFKSIQFSYQQYVHCYSTILMIFLIHVFQVETSLPS